MKEVCKNCKYRSGVCIYWVVDARSNEWLVASTIAEPDIDPRYFYPGTLDTFGCNEWKEKVTGPFRVKGQGVQFFDGKFWAESAWSSENLEEWLNRMWARCEESTIRLDISTAIRRRYQPVIRIGERVFPIGKCFYCEINAKEWIDKLKEGL